MTGGELAWTGTSGKRLAERPGHRAWLMDEARRLILLFQRATLNPAGGFYALDVAGKALPPAGSSGVVRHLHETTRMVHCFAIAHLLGLPGADGMIDHGMRFLESHHRDRRHGGWVWSVDDHGPVNASKQAYGHAFVLLAASSAKVVGHPMADGLMEQVTGILLKHFWNEAAGATTEEYGADWSPLGSYRGQNSNMHLCEALMAAFEASADPRYLTMAERIATLIIDRHARSLSWRVGEHFHADWTLDKNYEGDPMFRPAGSTPGHALEWSRLLIQLWELGGRRHGWMKEAAQSLFLTTCETGWDGACGGFYYTLDWDNRPSRPDRYWWPCAEGIGAAAVLGQVSDDARFEAWYRRIWNFTATHLIDHEHGGWYPELDGTLSPVYRVFTGKPDLYHSLQACLIPLLPASGSITRGLARQAAT
jgi:mannose/cellobiose epimerase-like protein (N-acyl-D-glucosamine 2-epimerase family)